MSNITQNITFGLITAAVAFLYGEARAGERYYYPVCSPVAHEVQVSFQAGELTEREARQIIEACLQWEDSVRQR